MIALLCPTKGRPKECARMIKSAQQTAILPIRVYLGLSAYDSQEYESHCDETICPDGMPTVHIANLLAEKALKNPLNSLFAVACDDVIFSTPGWDKALAAHYNQLQNKIHVYHLRDSRDENGTPHPVMTREWIEAMGYFLPPIFLHWYCDSWAVDIARANWCFTHMKDYQLIHDKPSDRGKPDETHLEIRCKGWHERDKWVNDHCQQFLALEKSRLKMKMVGDERYHRARDGVGE